MAIKPQQPVGSKPDNPTNVIDQVTNTLRETAEGVVPWFLDQMPLMYFQDTSEADQLAHLRAMIAAKASGRPIELTLRSEDSSQWTMIRPRDYPGVLAEIMEELPWDQTLRTAKIHTATDGELVLDTFEFGEPVPFTIDDEDHVDRLNEMIDYASEHMPEVTSDQVREYFSRSSEEYILTVTPLRMVKHWNLVERLSGTDGTMVELERETDPSLSRIVVAVSNSTRRSMLQRIATRLSKSRVNIHRAYLDSIDDGQNGWITLVGCVVQGPEGGPIDESSQLWQEIRHDLLRLKWYDQRTIELGYDNPEIGLRKAEIIIALLDLSYQILVKKNPYAFNPTRLQGLMVGNLDVAVTIADLLHERFDPNNLMSDDAFEAAKTRISEHIENTVDLEDARTLFETMVLAVNAVKRTNVFLEDRYALSMRIDASILTTTERADCPYGVFFVHGRDFNGFHVRFRDIARGGVRAIFPRGIEQYSREQERLYDEAYNLASAQQLKNKDIPEGGSKAAILVHPRGRISRSVKAFVDSLLDLITPEEETAEKIVDHLHHEELIYLGPDENITPELIEWVVDRGQRRGYPMPTALMSSKPGAGINHKAYGVTSEGVVVFLDTALRAIGIDPDKETFTIKMTGGPDGDVGGNGIRILNREYGDRAKIVGIADGSGCGEDPDGLQHEELLRLFENELPIAHYNKEKLGPNGWIASIDDPEGVHLRNTLHDRIEADAFVPCGGRPATIHGGNWKNFLKEDGSPSSPVIVEGANLFLTPDARRELSNAGTLILKDSSANKCGVICSSFEIGACMLLNTAQFMEIKETFVEQVLVRLRDLARAEAELLARLHQHHPHLPLPEMSIRISKMMSRTADSINEHWDEMTEQQQLELQRLVTEHLPDILLETAGDAVWSNMPTAYIRWMMVKSLAARMVYREGFEYLETMENDDLAGLALRYLDLEQERSTLVDAVLDSDLQDKHRIASLLHDAGIFSTMGRRNTEI
ncbi:MAG: NAD-glutamate dehydrogenase [Phycisphaerales bacterium]|jgi:glutamate dehydrogenase|nr:NAD-glutamate dehydrogenase [Phycisphaerales bacterium]